jgi:DHA1 family inner membrane transport protein
MKASSTALLSLALGGLCVGTTEFAAVGLLPFISSSLGASIPQTGHIISAYALGVMIGAPLLTVLAARLDRKILLVGLMSFYTAGNLLSALAPSLGWLILGRFAAGLPHGAFFGVGAVMGARVAGPGRRGQAVAIMMAGLTVANIVGVPAVTWAGQALGWRLSYVGVGLLGLITVFAIGKWIPRFPVRSGASMSGEFSALRNGPLWLVFASGAVGFGGMFAVYSYVSPLLTSTADLPLRAVPLVLSLFGVGMTVGALVGGRLADRSVIGAALLGFVLTAAVLLGLGLMADRAWAAVIGIFALGLAAQILAIAFQARLMDLSPTAPSLGASLCHSGLNIGNAAGAWLGGLALAAGYGNLAPAWVGLCLTVAGGLLFLAALRFARPRLPA